jgi:hypothetical protein
LPTWWKPWPHVASPRMQLHWKLAPKQKPRCADGTSPTLREGKPLKAQAAALTREEMHAADSILNSTNSEWLRRIPGTIFGLALMAAAQKARRTLLLAGCWTVAALFVPALMTILAANVFKNLPLSKQRRKNYSRRAKDARAGGFAVRWLNQRVFAFSTTAATERF